MERTTHIWNIMRFAYGIVLVLAGLDKFGFNLIVNWAQYISPPVLGVIEKFPAGVPAFLIGMGIVEIVVGIMFMTKWPRLAGHLAVAWLVLISINLLMLNLKDIAIRDLLLAVGAFAIAELTLVEFTFKQHTTA